MGYTRDAYKGISWLGTNRFAIRIVSLLRQMVLARLLSPAQFGIFAVGTMVLTFTEIITETGINVFLIQKKDSIDQYVNTAWVVSIVRGIIISLLIACSSPFIAKLVNSPKTIPLILLISIVPFIRGFINPAVAKFLKELQFHKEFYYRSSIFFVEAFVSISLALQLRTEMSLAIGLIVSALYEVVISFMMIKPHPTFQFEKPYFKEIIHRGKWLTASSIFTFFYQNGDNLVVARMLGMSSLGLYDRAYAISLLPITEITDTIGKATFPIYVKIAHEKDRFRRAYFKSFLLICSIAIPSGLLLFLFPRQIITFLFGNNWVAAAPALRILAILSIVRALTVSALAPLYGAARQEMVTMITLVGLTAMAIVIIPLVNSLQLVGAATAALIGTLTTIPFVIYFLQKIFSNPQGVISGTSDKVD